MVRTHALPSQVTGTQRLDATRIATLSGTLAINLLAMGLLMMPLSLPPPIAHQDTPADLVFDWIPRKPEPPVQVPVLPQPVPPPTQAASTPTPRTLTQAPTQAPAAAVLSDTGIVAPASDTQATDSGPVADIAPASAGPAPMQLRYANAPAPTYPRNALRQGITGSVLLQVVVDVGGRPVDVVVARSSGNRELDAAAKAQVLKRWTFQPAMRDGRAVQAVGMVPIAFSLQD